MKNVIRSSWSKLRNGAIVSICKIVFEDWTSIINVVSSENADFDILSNHMIKIDKKYYKPILISEIEEKRVGDDIYNETTCEIYKNVDKETLQLINDQSFRSDGDRCFKILALPELFSVSHLEDLTNKKINNGDTVLLECEIHDEWLKENPPFSGPYIDQEYYQLKLDLNNKIIFHKK